MAIDLTREAEMEHDHMNVLVLGGRVIGEETAHELVGAFVGAQTSEEERHLRRLAKIDAIEARCGLELLSESPDRNRIQQTKER
jgi:ribose 5-phosphate isomerase RpiB